jgi:uncharacterized protein
MTHVFLFLYKRKWFGLILLVLLVAVAIPYVLRVEISLNIKRVLATAQGDVAPGDQWVSLVNGKVVPVKEDVSDKDKLSAWTPIIYRFSSKSSNVLSYRYLSALKRMEEEILGSMKGVVVKSILSVKTPEVTGVVFKCVLERPLIERVRMTEQEQKQVKRRIKESGYFLNDLVDSKFTTTTVVVLLPRHVQKDAYGTTEYNKLIDITEKYRGEFKQVKELSILTSSAYEWNTVTSEIPLLAFIMIGLMSLIGGVLTRNAIYSLFIFIICVVNLVLSGALMGVFGWKFNTLCMALPLIVVVVGSTELIHLLCSYVKGLRKFHYDRLRAAVFMINDVGFPCMLTAATTAFGLFSFAFSQSVALTEVGLAGGCAMTICGLTSLFFLPLLLSFLPEHRFLKKRGEDKFRLFDQIREEVVKFFNEKMYWVYSILVVLFLASVFFLFNVKNDIVTFNHYRSDHALTHSINEFHKDFGGVGFMKVEIGANKKVDFFDNDVFFKIVHLERRLRQDKRIDSVLSYPDMVFVVMNKTLGKSVDDVVDRADLGGSEQALLNKIKSKLSAEHLKSFLSVDRDVAKLFIRYQLGTLQGAKKLEHDVVHEVSHIMGNDFKVRLSYTKQKVYKAYGQLYLDAFYGFVLCAIVIFLVFCLQYKNLIVGFLALLPNVLAVVSLLGLMGLLHINLNPMTFAALMVTISVGVDFTVHLYFKYRRLCDLSADKIWIASEVLGKTIGPLFISTLAIFVPMIISSLSDHLAISYTSFLIAFGIVFSFIYNVFFSTIIFRKMNLFFRKE